MHTRRCLFALAIGTLVALMGGTAHAGVPSPATSFVDPCIRICPGGDITFHVVVRDAASNPVVGSTVLLDLCIPIPEGRQCPNVVFCPPGPNDGYTVNNCLVMTTTNAAGVADYHLRAGGTCGGASIRVFADGVILATRNSIASPDQNGDLTVNAVDNGILGAKLGGPYDPTADLNCSGALEIGDPDVFNGHLGHMCDAVVPVMPRSWGSVKIIYR